MQLVCISPFGNFQPGDYVEVPDDTEVFDRTHFNVVPAEPVTTIQGGE